MAQEKRKIKGITLLYPLYSKAREKSTTKRKIQRIERKITMDAFMTTTKRVQTDRMYQQADREAIAVVAENANMAQEKRADTMERAAQGAKQAQKPSAMETLRSLEVFGVAAGGCLTAAAGLAITGNLPAAGIVAAAGIGVYVLGGAK